MHTNRAIRTIAFVLLIAASSVAVEHSFFGPASAIAQPAAQSSYKVLSVGAETAADELERKINEISSQGWQLHSVIEPHTGDRDHLKLIFRKSA